MPDGTDEKPTPDDSPPPARLTPPPPSSSMALLGGALAISLGLFASLMLYFGVPALVFVLRKGNRNSTAFAGDVFAAALFTIIGVFCAAIAIRWLRAAVRSMRSQ